LRVTNKYNHLIFFSCFCIMMHEATGSSNFRDTVQTSTFQQAIEYLDGLPEIDSSHFWPNVSPELFMENLQAYVRTPLKTFESKGTNFCSYTALSWLPIQYNPLGFVKFMVKLYQEGKATMGRVNFSPGWAVRQTAGTLRYKGILDISPASQMWFLSLADHFKGYLNFFNRKFNKGDENTLWAATNFAKFNRMLRKLFPWKIRARGSDLIKPGNIDDIYTHLEERLKTGTVFLYLNNRLLYKKKHVVTRFGIPTHFIVLLELRRNGDKIDMVYMDYGRKTLQQVSPGFLKKIIFGITHCKNKPVNVF
jgi:hypothetical protein